MNRCGSSGVDWRAICFRLARDGIIIHTKKKTGHPRLTTAVIQTVP